MKKQWEYKILSHTISIELTSAREWDMLEKMGKDSWELVGPPIKGEGIKETVHWLYYFKRKKQC